MTPHRIFGTKFAAVYPLYVQKAERKGRTKEEVDEVVDLTRRDTPISHEGGPVPDVNDPMWDLKQGLAN